MAEILKKIIQAIVFGGNPGRAVTLPLAFTRICVQQHLAGEHIRSVMCVN